MLDWRVSALVSDNPIDEHESTNCLLEFCVRDNTTESPFLRRQMLLVDDEPSRTHIDSSSLGRDCVAPEPVI